MLSLCTGKGGIRAVDHIGGHRLLIQQIKDAVGTGEHLGQAGTEVGQRHHRAKGAQGRQGADQHPFRAQLAILIQPDAYPSTASAVSTIRVLAAPTVTPSRYFMAFCFFPSVSLWAVMPSARAAVFWYCRISRRPRRLSSR